LPKRRVRGDTEQALKYLTIAAA
jgi:hypothetical protein